ncbi:hypothetical protein Q9966_001452 [Columba livia]|nr:hypothetical protein Q9966_001452 [Columba livia]
MAGFEVVCSLLVIFVSPSNQKCSPEASHPHPKLCRQIFGLEDEWPVNESSAEQALPLHSSTCHAVPWLRSLSDVGSDGSWETWCFLSASFQSILTIEMKKQQRFLNEDGDGDGRKPNAIPPLDDWASEADVQDFSTGQGGDHPHLSHQALTQDPQEREASSADSGTIQIKDKLKTKRMSEGLSASYRGLTDCDDPTGVTLKPVDSGSASQKLRVTSKTMSATQNRPVSSETSMLSDGEQEHGENDTDYGASDEDNMELMSESKGYKVNNLRSKVCCCAINTLGVLFGTMKKDMDHEVDEIARVLLRKMGDSSDFIQTAANQSLGLMVGSVTPARAMAALMASGVQHRNVLVRKTAAEHLLTAMERIGAKKLLSGIPTSTEVLVCMLSILTIEMKKQQRFLNEDADGDGRKPNAIPPLDDWASEADVQDFSTGQGGDHPHLSHQALTQDPQEREASSADSGTIQIKDKLKTKMMSEGLSASYRGQDQAAEVKRRLLNLEVGTGHGCPKKNIEVQTLEPILPALQHRVARDVKSARRLREPVAPLPNLPPRQAKETSHRVRARLLSVDDFKISNEKIRVVLYESAWMKIDQQQMRERKIVLREREEETEKSLRLPALNIDPGDAANKVNSLPPIALDSSKAGDEPECRDAQEAKPDPNPQQALLNALTWLSSDD